MARPIHGQNRRMAPHCPKTVPLPAQGSGYWGYWSNQQQFASSFYCASSTLVQYRHRRSRQLHHQVMRTAITLTIAAIPVVAIAGGMGGGVPTAEVTVVVKGPGSVQTVTVGGALLPGPINCGNNKTDCFVLIPVPTALYLRAFPRQNASFESWSGGLPGSCIGSHSVTCPISLRASGQIQANFLPHTETGH